MTKEATMARRCPNCDQQLLADEITCWQCGYDVRDEPKRAAGVATVSEAQRQRVSAMTIYGALAALVVAAALLTTMFLGQQPLVQPAEVALPEGWTRVADRGRRFTMYLPKDWEQMDAANRQQRAELERLMAQNVAYRRATDPLGAYVDDDHVFFIAREPTGVAGGSLDTFLLVATSATLNRLAPDDVTALAEEGHEVVREATLINDYDRSHVALRVEIPDVGQKGLHCRQQFSLGEREALLFALCRLDSSLDERTASTILGSFQQLAP